MVRFDAHDQPVTLSRQVSRDAFFRLAVRWELLSTAFQHEFWSGLR